jgi:hypothetical protein
VNVQFKVRLAVAFVIFGLLVASVFAIQWFFLSQPPSTVLGSYRLDETFSAASFLYGPQAWIPYAAKLAVIPGVAVDSKAAFYLMFVDLNATSNLNATFPCVRVDYAFTGLHGVAAFHVYGYIKDNSGLSWTNRVDDSGASGYYVNVASSGSAKALPKAKPMTAFDHVCVKVSNVAGATFNDYGNNTYFMKFEKDGGGLNSLHITTSQNDPSGNVTTTNSLKGTFYVDYSGGRVQDDFVLAVAVNGMIGNDFRLNLESSVPG